MTKYEKDMKQLIDTCKYFNVQVEEIKEISSNKYHGTLALTPEGFVSAFKDDLEFIEITTFEDTDKVYARLFYDDIRVEALFPTENSISNFIISKKEKNSKLYTLEYIEKIIHTVDVLKRLKLQNNDIISVNVNINNNTSYISEVLLSSQGTINMTYDLGISYNIDSVNGLTFIHNNVAFTCSTLNY